MKLTIENNQGELLDTLVEGNLNSNTTVVLVHGFGTDKHETAHYFDDISKALATDYRILRFDFSGCGKSEGKSEEIDYKKHAGDIQIILDLVKKTYQGRIYILAQSMGTFITALLSPEGIDKTIFTSIPNTDTQFTIERLIQRFGARPGAHIDFDGISILPRSSGINQKIGPSFWKVLQSIKPIEIVKEFANKTKLYIIHANQDEIVGTTFLEGYATIPNVTIEWIDGDHSFTKDNDRKLLIERIKKFYS